MIKECMSCGSIDKDYDTAGEIIDNKYYCFSCKGDFKEVKIEDEVEISEPAISNIFQDMTIQHLTNIDNSLIIIKNIALYWFITTIVVGLIVAIYIFD